MKFLFVADFDGTITAQDFYIQILYRYEHNKIFSNYKKRGVELLIDVLQGANLTEKEFLKEIEHIPIDPYFSSFCSFIKEAGGDLLILSAGCKYYIEKKLDMVGVKNVKIVANDGVFENGRFKFLRNEDERFYCKTYGIGKYKVINFYKQKYDSIFYAGDSFVDFKACKMCDVRFAKKNLAKILSMFCLDFYEFKSFKDIENILINYFGSNG